MTTATNALVVISVDEASVLVAVNGANRRLSWGQLGAACGQDDRELAAAYQGVYRQAAALAANGPVVVSVHRDYTDVWWVCTVSALCGGGEANYDRRRDEGGTHPNQLLAALEAADICDRLGARVARREGFDAAEARRRCDKILAR